MKIVVRRIQDEDRLVELVVADVRVLVVLSRVAGSFVQLGREDRRLPDQGGQEEGTLQEDPVRELSRRRRAHDLWPKRAMHGCSREAVPWFF